MHEELKEIGRPKVGERERELKIDGVEKFLTCKLLKSLRVSFLLKIHLLFQSCLKLNVMQDALKLLEAEDFRK